MASRAAAATPPSYPSAARIFDSQCYPQYTASLKCLEEFYADKSKCQEQFDVYKACKKREVNGGQVTENDCFFIVSNNRSNSMK